MTDTSATEKQAHTTKVATRPGSKWAHGKRRASSGVSLTPSKDPGKGFDWHAGARVRRPK
jgi:hypothetical protein